MSLPVNLSNAPTNLSKMDMITAAPKLDILLKCITLLYREKELGEEANDNSRDLVRTIVNLYKDTSRSFRGGETSTIDDVKNIVINLINNPDTIEKSTLLASLEMALKDRANMFTIVEKTIASEMSSPAAKRSIVSLRNQLNNYYKEQQITATVKKASYVLERGLEDMSIQDFTAQLVTNLEALAHASKSKDPGIMDEIDFTDINTVSNIIGRVKKTYQEGGRLSTGWRELNDMLQGGFNRGEMVMINALQHKYKSGFTQSLFAQIALHNKPTLFDKNKKPLVVLFSFEDNAENISEFLYKYLYTNDPSKTEPLPDIKDLDESAVSAYIKERLSVHGFNIKIYRINPSEWTYKHLFNKVLELEADGYEIVAAFADYLAKLPTTGCVHNGTTGSDYHDMFNRCRNFFSSL